MGAAAAVSDGGSQLSDRGALTAGGRAFEALRRRGHLLEARDVASWLPETTRRSGAEGTDDPEALRDLSVSLDNVGRIDRALGELEPARAAFAEALEIGERLAAALPNQVDYKDLPALFRLRLNEFGDLLTESPPAGYQSSRK